MNANLNAQVLGHDSILFKYLTISKAVPLKTKDVGQKLFIGFHNKCGSNLFSLQ
jgi:hypothetical protein